MKPSSPWKDDESIAPELRELMSHGHNLAPNEEQLARIKAGVNASVGATSELDGTKLPAGPKPVQLAFTKGYAVLATIALIGGTLWVALGWPDRSNVERKSAPPPASPTLQVVSPTLPVPPPATLSIDSPPLGATQDMPKDGLRPEVRRGRRPAPSVPNAALLDDEATLLRGAKQAMTTTAQRAVDLTLKHERDYPEGTLREEREALLIEAMWRIGRAKDAERRFAAFQKRYPHSPYARRIASWLTAKPASPLQPSP